MSEELERTSQTMEYEKPPAKGHVFSSRRVRILLIVILVLGLLITMAVLGYPQLLMLTAFLSPFIFAAWRIIAAKSKKKKYLVTEEEFEAEWNSRQELKNNMVDIAKQVFPQSPLGKWQMRVVTYPQRGWPKVHEEKFLELTDGGQGFYRWIQHDLSMSCETTFKYKPGEKGTIFVLLTVPRSNDWIPVTFDFDMGKNDVGEEELKLWMEGENPFDGEMEMHWPFDETFVRAAQ